jgi:hypothetical protein
VRSPSSKKIIGSLLLCAAVLFVWWYIEAENFSDGIVTGEYVLAHDNITQRLTLKRDHTFEQEDTVDGMVHRATGTWRVFSRTGHMSFSPTFIDAPIAWRGQDKHEVFGLFKNYFGFISLTFFSDNASITTFKKPLS